MLDDSTDRVTRDLVDDKIVEWRERGVNIEVMRRTNRAGYKAGALKEVGPSMALAIASPELQHDEQCKSICSATMFYCHVSP